MSGSSDQKSTERSLEEIKKHFKDTLPWSLEKFVPKFEQLFSSSDSEKSYQPFNDIHLGDSGSDTDVEDNTDTSKNSPDFNQEPPLDQYLSANQKLKSEREKVQSEFLGVLPNIAHKEQQGINIETKITSICYLENEKIAINYSTFINIDNCAASVDKFVIVFDKLSKTIVLKAKGNLQNY